MTKNEFMRIAKERNLCSGRHYIVYDDGTVEAYCIFALSYSGFRYEYKSPVYGDSEEYANKYLNTRIEAYKKESTLFVKRGAPPIYFANALRSISTEVENDCSTSTNHTEA